jgi:hypothetical protein
VSERTIRQTQKRFFFDRNWCQKDCKPNLSELAHTNVVERALAIVLVLLVGVLEERLVVLAVLVDKAGEDALAAGKSRVDAVIGNQGSIREAVLDIVRRQLAEGTADALRN